MKKNILIVTGSRAEYGLLKPTILEIKKSSTLRPTVLVTGTHVLPKYGFTINDISEDEVRISHVVKISEENDMLGWLAEEVVGIRNYCRKKQPDLILVLGDRGETLAGALVGSHLGIPVAHIHGGDVTGAVTVDDKVRDAITILATIHFPVSKNSATRIQLLVKRQKNKIHLIGNQKIEENIDNLYPKSRLAQMYNLSPKKPWIVLLHHPTPLDKLPYEQQIESVLAALRGIEAEVIGIFPNSDSGTDYFLKKLQAEKIFAFIAPSLPRHVYLSLLSSSNMLIGNSSSGVLEAPIFKTPFIHVGKRQQGRRKYNLMLTVDYQTDEIKSAIFKILKKIRPRVKLSNPKNPSSILIRKYLEKYFEHD